MRLIKMWKWTDGTNALMHYGVPKMKWGVRRYQYEDGSLTPLGREHYGIGKKREGRSSLLGPAKQALRDMKSNRQTRVHRGEVISEAGGPESYKEKIAGKYDPSNPTKDAPLSQEAKKLIKTYDSEFKKYYSNIGGNNIWNYLANATDDFGRRDAIAKSIIEQALRTNQKPKLGMEEYDAVSSWIINIDELGLDFPGTFSKEDMRNAFEYDRRFGGR